MNNIDLNYYSLEEIKKELNYNKEEFENIGFKSVKEKQIENIKKDLDERTIISEEIEESDEMEV